MLKVHYFGDRIDPDCIGVFLYEAKSGISQIYYVNSGIWLGRFQKTSCNFCAIPRNAVERQDFVEIGAFELN